MAQGYIDPDYVDVAERIRLFYAQYPDGRLVTVRHGHTQTNGKEFVFVEAQAYRTADDPQPCSGTAWEPIPGPTPFTKDSELMNAETAAWGRAIIAAGIPSKKIASSEEIKARKPARRASRSASPPPAAAALSNQQKRIVIEASTNNIDDTLRHRITRRITGVTSAKDVPDSQVEKVVQAIRWLVDHPEESIRRLEEWERDNGLAV